MPHKKVACDAFEVYFKVLSLDIDIWSQIVKLQTQVQSDDEVFDFRTSHGIGEVTDQHLGSRYTAETDLGVLQVFNSDLFANSSFSLSFKLHPASLYTFYVSITAWAASSSQWAPRPVLARYLCIPPAARRLCRHVFSSSLPLTSILWIPRTELPLRYPFSLPDLLQGTAEAYVACLYFVCTVFTTVGFG